MRVPTIRVGAPRRGSAAPDPVCSPTLMVISVAVGVLASGFFLGQSMGPASGDESPTTRDRIANLEDQLASASAYLYNLEDNLGGLLAEERAVVPFNATAQPRSPFMRLGRGGSSLVLLVIVLVVFLIATDATVQNALKDFFGLRAKALSPAKLDQRLSELSAAVKSIETTLDGKADCSANGSHVQEVDKVLDGLLATVKNLEGTMSTAGDSGKGSGEPEESGKEAVDIHLKKLDASIHSIKTSLSKKADNTEVAENVKKGVCGGVTRVEWDLSTKDLSKFGQGDEAKSPEFAMGCINGLDLRFYPKGVKNGSATHCALFLGAPKNTRLKCRLSVDDASSRQGEHDYQKDLDFFGVVEFEPIKPTYSKVAVELISGHQEREIPGSGGEKLIYRFEVPSVKV